LEQAQVWNHAVFALGSTHAYMDVALEAPTTTTTGTTVENTETSVAAVAAAAAAIHRLHLELATTAMPLATQNFCQLLTDHHRGYTHSTLHRVEKKVGLMGGLIAVPDTIQPVGRCHETSRIPHSPTNMDVSSERLVLHHLPGTITMVSPRVGEVDSRFLLLGDHAPHLDGGNAVPIGRLDEQSFRQVRHWERTLITHRGRPTNVVLRIVECGVLGENKHVSVMTAVPTTETTCMTAGADR
jgi:cyclophilin family peptidyl-prolyl cis-trans isomerase